MGKRKFGIAFVIGLLAYFSHSLCCCQVIVAYFVTSAVWNLDNGRNLYHDIYVVKLRRPWIF